MPDVKEVINGLEMSYKYSNVNENNTLVPQWIVLHALALLKAQEPRVMTDTELEAIRKAPLILKPNVDAVPVVHGQWVDEKGNPVPWCDALPSSPAYSCWCNQCGTWLVASDEYPVYGLFCPACGAKMDGKRMDDDAAD